MTETERLAITLQALRDVINPLAWLRRERGETQDRVLSDDLVLSWIRNPFTYISIARVALRALGEETCTHGGACEASSSLPWWS